MKKVRKVQLISKRGADLKLRNRRRFSSNLFSRGKPIALNPDPAVFLKMQVNRDPANKYILKVKKHLRNFVEYVQS